VTTKKKTKKPPMPRIPLPPTDDAEPAKAAIARLKARRDAIRAGVRNPRPATTPLALSFSKKSKPRTK